MTRSTSTPSPGADDPRGTVSRLAPADTVLVLVDLQNDFCHPDGTMGRRGLDLGAVPGAVANAGRLAAAARATGVPVVHVRTEHGPDVDSPAWRHRLTGGIGGDHRPALTNCRAGGWGAEFHRVHPLPGEWVSVKHRYSAFSTPGFAGRLAALGRPALLFAGVTTNVCVESSLRSAVDTDFLGSLVRDASAAYTGAEHAAAVAVTDRHLGMTFTTDRVLAAWHAAAGGPPHPVPPPEPEHEKEERGSA